MGYFVAIDGLSGSGKSTAIATVSKLLRKQGYTVGVYHDRLSEPNAAALDAAQHHVELFRHMFLADRLGEKLEAAQSFQEIFELLRGYPLMGNFMAYQTAVDLNYSDLVTFEEDDFTVPGPGALRGIQKVFENFGDYSPGELVLWMVEHQEAEFARLQLPPATLFGRKLHAIDCQGLFCETDKYCREAAPELASARKRIKARFRETPKAIPYWFPPKWGIAGAAAIV